MPTVYIRTNPQPASVGSTRTITIGTAAATAVYSIAGYMGWQLVNVGPSTLTYGDSSMAMGTGGLLYYSMAKEWYPIADTMSLYLRADSVAGTVLVNDYL